MFTPHPQSTASKTCSLSARPAAAAWLGAFLALGCLALLVQACGHAPRQCSGGARLVGKRCFCPQGTVWDGARCAGTAQAGACQGGAIQVEGLCYCPDGYVWTDASRTACAACTGGAYPDGDQCVCPPGAVWYNNHCACPEGTGWSEGQGCLPLQCANGSIPQGNGCVCPPGTHVVGDGCFCSDGTPWTGRQCGAEVAQQSCPGNSVWVGSECQCLDGTAWNGTECVTLQQGPPPAPVQHNTWVNQNVNIHLNSTVNSTVHSTGSARETSNVKASSSPHRVDAAPQSQPACVSLGGAGCSPTGARCCDGDAVCDPRSANRCVHGLMGTCQRDADCAQDTRCRGGRCLQ